MRAALIAVERVVLDPANKVRRVDHRYDRSHSQARSASTKQ